ncbi:hypothetical protein [uncultured Aquimarina sp.]|uniref:hypothetical protein n=1 Tax=uncultured Aquimarina sp. TaxID=575652 RepID=UPI00262572A3|nr:hypothetical protein [uncultured Aquimarina sp.]
MINLIDNNNMMILDLNQIEINKQSKARETFVENLKIFIAIKPLQYLFQSKSQVKLHELRLLPEGTIGKDVFKMLNSRHLKIIPKFEEHDMKHIILGYSMSSIDEIRMQAYLFGNGNYNIFCLLFLASGIMFPEYWNTFYKDYKKGKNAISMSNLTFEKCKMKLSKDLKTIYCKK